jgi:hypothetical protein
MTADIAFYAELARAADGPLVELAIGNGRVAIPVAQATGRRVVGIGVEALYGGFEREPLVDTSDEYVFVARAAH